MSSLRALRALLRVELRACRRHPGRSLLIVLLIAVPVAGMVGAAALLETTRATPQERRQNAMGAARLRVDLGEAQSPAEVRALLAPDTPLEILWRGSEELRVPGRRLRAHSFAMEPEALGRDGLASGLLRLAAGTAPRRADEVALSPLLLAALGLDLGDALELRDGRRVTVCGRVVDPEDLERALLLRGVEGLAPTGARTLLVGLAPEREESLAASLRRAGLRVTRRSEVGQADAFESLVIFVVGGFALFEASLVIAAAFAVGLRRRQREIGLLRSSGATARAVQLAQCATAGALALLGSGVGVLVGAATARCLHPFLDGWNGRANGPFELSGVHILGATSLGLATAMLAAWVPARGASRLAIRVALGGRRPVTSSSRRWLVWGGLGLGLGTWVMVLGARDPSDTGAWAGALVLFGSVLAVLGLSACSPWLLDRLARLAGPLPLAWRLAVRDAGRFRGRNGPVVCAVLAGMSISILLASFLHSLESLLDQRPATLRDDQLFVDGPAAEEVAARLAERFELRARAPMGAVYHQGAPLELRLVSTGGAPHDEPSAPQPLGFVACGDEQLLVALGLATGRDAFLAGRPIATRPLDGELRLQAGGAALGWPLPGVQTVSVDQEVRGPALLLHVDALAAQGLRAGPPPGRDFRPHFIRLTEPIGAADAQAAVELAGQLAPDGHTSVDALALQGSPTGSLQEVVLALSLLTGLIVIFIATSLSAVESSADARALHTVGAAPSMLRRHAAARSGYLACLGGVLALPAGLLPAAALLSMADLPLEFAFPWPEALCTVIGLPLLAYGGTWCATRIADPLPSDSAS